MVRFIESKATVWAAFILVAFSYAMGLIVSLADPDLWGYMAFGYTFWTEPGFPYTDPFSYMPVNPVWIYHEWLTGVIFFPLYAGIGEEALQALRYIFAFLTLFLAYAAAKKRGAKTSLALLGLFFPAFAICTGFGPVRAQVFTYFFFALTLYLLETCRLSQRFKPLWLFPPVILLWCNLHGGFVAGLAIVGLYAAGEFLSRKPWKPYLFILAPCLAATLINPYGWTYWTYLVKAILMPRPEIYEWMSIWKAMSMGFKHLAIPLFMGLFPLAVLFCLKPLQKNWSAVLVLAAVSWMAFSHMRHIPFMGIAMAALLPSGADYFIKTKSREASILLGAALLSMACLAVLNAKVVWAHFHYPQVLRNPLSIEALPESQVLPGQMAYPVDGVAFIREKGLHGNILTEFDWGQFVMWSLPDSKVSMDGRYETVYPDKVCREYFAFAYGKPGAEEYLTKYPHEIALLKERSVTSAQLAASPDWLLAYKGDGCLVFLKNLFLEKITKKAIP